MKTNQTIAQFLNIKVELDKPFTIKHNGNTVYYEISNGFWYKREYDSNGNRIYYEDSDGYITDYRVKELTLDEIAEKFNIPVSQLKIKK